MSWQRRFGKICVEKGLRPVSTRALLVAARCHSGVIATTATLC
jgi:hypothetical protein